MTKSLANRLFLKYKLYIFKMMPRKTLEDYIDDFNKIILDLENIEIKMDEKDQALLLLRSLPSQFENLSDTLIYGKDSITLEEVQSTLYSKELKNKSKEKEDSETDLLECKCEVKSQIEQK